MLVHLSTPVSACGHKANAFLHQLVDATESCSIDLCQRWSCRYVSTATTTKTRDNGFKTVTYRTLLPRLNYNPFLLQLAVSYLVR